MNNYIDEAMEIAHDKTQSIFQQRNEFERLFKQFAEESKAKLLEMLKQEKEARDMWEINNPRF